MVANGPPLSQIPPLWVREMGLGNTQFTKIHMFTAIYLFRLIRCLIYIDNRHL